MVEYKGQIEGVERDVSRRSDLKAAGHRCPVGIGAVE